MRCIYLKEEQFIVFGLGEEQYIVSILDIKEIVNYVQPTKVPGVGYHVEGVINLRGKIIPIINLGKQLGIDTKENSEKRIMIFDFGNHQVGCVVDSVEEVKRFQASDIEEAPRDVKGDSDYIKGIAKDGNKLFILIDLKGVLEGLGDNETYN